MYHIHNVAYLKKAARNMYDFDNLKNSKKNGEYNIFGAMGEIYIYELFKPYYNVQGISGNPDFDLIIQKMKIEVKTEMVNRMPPSENWDSKIFESSMHQKPDWYFFVKVTKDLCEACFVGMISRADWIKKSTAKKKGEQMKDNGGKAQFYLDDCRVLSNAKLSRFKDVRLNTLHNTYKTR